jgi:hypothetical protein
MFKEAELFCEAGLPGMLFSIVGVSVFVPFIRVDHEGDESMFPKLLEALITDCHHSWF